MRTIVLFTVASALVSVSSPAQLCGDCTDDGIVTIVDALCTAQIVVGVLAPTPRQLASIDVNGDLSIDVLDAFAIALHVAGLRPTLSCPPSSSPSCEIRHPVGTTVAGDVPIRFDVVDIDTPTLDVEIAWSIDSGFTWSWATPAASSPPPYDANPAVGMPPRLAEEFHWDSHADIPEGYFAVLLRIGVDDGRTSSSCHTEFLLDNQ